MTTKMVRTMKPKSEIINKRPPRRAALTASASKVYTVTLDSKGRMIFPKELRDMLHVGPGDVLYIRPDRIGASIRKGINPFDALAEDAIRQYQAGETMSLDELAAQEGIELD